MATPQVVTDPPQQTLETVGEAQILGCAGRPSRYPLNPGSFSAGVKQSLPGWTPS